MRLGFSKVVSSYSRLPVPPPFPNVKMRFCRLNRSPPLPYSHRSSRVFGLPREIGRKSPRKSLFGGFDQIVLRALFNRRINRAKRLVEHLTQALLHLPDMPKTLEIEKLLSKAASQCSLVEENDNHLLILSKLGDLNASFQKEFHRIAAFPSLEFLARAQMIIRGIAETPRLKDYITTPIGTGDRQMSAQKFLDQIASSDAELFLLRRRGIKDPIVVERASIIWCARRFQEEGNLLSAFSISEILSPYLSSQDVVYHRPEFTLEGAQKQFFQARKENPNSRRPYFVVVTQDGMATGRVLGALSFFHLKHAAPRKWASPLKPPFSILRWVERWFLEPFIRNRIHRIFAVNNQLEDGLRLILRMLEKRKYPLKRLFETAQRFSTFQVHRSWLEDLVYLRNANAHFSHEQHSFALAPSIHFEKMMDKIVQEVLNPPLLEMFPNSCVPIWMDLDVALRDIIPELFLQRGNHILYRLKGGSLGAITEKKWQSWILEHQRYHFVDAPWRIRLRDFIPMHSNQAEVLHVGPNYPWRKALQYFSQTPEGSRGSRVIIITSDGSPNGEYLASIDALQLNPLLW